VSSFRRLLQEINNLLVGIETLSTKISSGPYGVAIFVTEQLDISGKEPQDDKDNREKMNKK
jgi:hypothetical protein